MDAQIQQQIVKLKQQSIEMRTQGHYKQAIVTGQKMLELTRQHLGEEHPDIAPILLLLAELYEADGDRVTARRLRREAKEKSDAASAPNNQATGQVPAAQRLQAQMMQHYKAGNYAAAIPLQERAVDLLSLALGYEHPDVGISLGNLASLYKEQGRYAEAQPLFERALAILEEALGSQHPDVATSLNSLASLYQAQGRYAEAEPLYERALAIQEKALGAEHPDVATSLNNLASLYQAQGRYAEAEPLYERTLAIREKALGSQHPAVATSLNNLASLYYAQSRYARAQTLYERVLAIREKTLRSQHPDVAVSLGNLAILYQDRGRYAEAQPLFERALAIQEKSLGSQHPDVATSLNNLAGLYKGRGSYAEAEPLYERALAVWEKALGAEHPHVAKSLCNLALLLVATGQAEKAFDLMQRAIAVEDALLGQLSASLAENQRMDFLVTLQPQFVRFLSLVASHFPADAEKAGAALDLTLRRKAVAAEALAVQQEAVLGGRYPHLKPLLNELTQLRRQIAQWTLAGPGEITLVAHQQRLAQANAKRDTMQATLARQIPEMNLQHRLREADRKAVALSLPQNAALVEFVRYDLFNFRAVPAPGEAQWLPARYVAFVLPAGKADDMRMVDLGEAEPIDRLVASFRATILASASEQRSRDSQVETAPVAGSREPAWRASGDELRRLLLTPLTAVLGGCRHLFMAPDGDLTRLPFEALPSEAAGRYVGEDYRLSYLAVGRDALRFEAATTVKPGLSLICANPDYALEASEEPPAFYNPLFSRRRIRTAVTSSSSTTTKQASRLSRDFDRGSLRFDALPGTEAEGKRIAARLGVTPWLSGDALEQRLKSIRSPYILHLATHGFFQPNKRQTLDDVVRFDIRQRNALSGPGMENPLLRAGLALAGVNTFLRGGPLPAAAEDGLLTAEDVTGMDLLATEMVVLSACETGLGDIQTGEGVMGLRRAFMLAGAKTLVMSLWRVEDVATALLMDRFYRNLLENSMERDIALHEAQQYVRTMTLKQVRQEVDWLSGGDTRRRAELLRDRFNLGDYGETDCPFAAPYYWAAFICQGSTKPFATNSQETERIKSMQRAEVKEGSEQ